MWHRIRQFIYYCFLEKANHKRNRIQAMKVLKTISTINGDFKEARQLTYLRKINPYVFEELIMTAFEKSGHKISRSRSYSGDEGCDGIVYDKKGLKFALQMKRYSDSIKLAHVTDFIEYIEVNRYSGGFFVHTGRTSDAIFNRITHYPLKVISGQRLINLLTENRLQTH